MLFFVCPSCLTCGLSVVAKGKNTILRIRRNCFTGAKNAHEACRDVLRTVGRRTAGELFFRTVLFFALDAAIFILKAHDIVFTKLPTRYFKKLHVIVYRRNAVRHFGQYRKLITRLGA